MSHGTLRGSSHPKHSRLARTGSAALAGAVLIAAGAHLARAQSPRQKFEVASIHRCSPNTVLPLREGGGLGEIGPSPNRVVKTCVTILSLLQDAYVIFDNGENRPPSSIQLPPFERAPAWISSDLFTIEAKADGTPGGPVMLGPMMQSLLEDRFHLKLHREARSGPAYELTVAKGGSRLKSHSGSCAMDVPPAAVPRDPATGRALASFASGRVSPPIQPGVPCRLRFNLNNGPNQLFTASAISMNEFCSYLSRATSHTVIDRTELKGTFDLRLEYLPDRVALGSTAVDQPEGPAAIQPGASLYTAVEQQLGLKLVSIKGTRQVIVIDHIEKPAAN